MGKNAHHNLLFPPVLIGLLVFSSICAQGVHVEGQLSGWALVNLEKEGEKQIGLRYIPNLSVQRPVSKNWTSDVELSVNTFGTGQVNGSNDIQTNGDLNLYRFWLRVASHQFEARVGLQKINFGSAAILRPLMWFDRIDSRDPLQITSGVYGLLFRYYFLNNANIWLWGLYGNDEVKGWETLPSDDGAVEFGGRFQYPLFTGELAFTYHHRSIDLKKGLQNLLTNINIIIPCDPLIFSWLNIKNIPENRFGLDGKWDISVGFWFESVLIHQDWDDLPAILNYIKGTYPIPFTYKYQRFINIGMDYTFGLGNGLHVLGEHFLFDVSETSFGPGKSMGTFTALSLNYLVGLLDRSTGMVYYDWENSQWYRFFSWQRTYDRWNLYLMGFWNPTQIQIYGSQQGSHLFAGKGLQFMAVFYH
ncbi:hypothetical protein JW824_09310 [bacterium]|nr:hypothetical protein [bacterium]RQV94290.1 MAG: hypothetical protein EH221_07515 [bacterium]